MEHKEGIYKKGITHGGIFHADDVFSTALLKILNPEIEIVRVFKVTDDMLQDDIMIFDIGFGEFDHHQKGAPIRENGIKYAAFGLLWKNLGYLLASNKNVNKFDETFVQFIDEADNGGALNPLTGCISAFVPSWDDNNQNMDIEFPKAVDFAIGILEREIKRMKSEEKANDIVGNALKQSDGEIVILDKFVPWQDTLIPSTAKFIVFPSLRGGWNAQAVPTELGKTDQKISFPAEWAGMSAEKLDMEVTGMNFCHVGRFMIGADSKESAINACRKTLGSWKN